jgi:hypothetical protein
MTRIYQNRPFARRMMLSTVVVVGAILFGFWELYSAFQSPEDSGYGPLFGMFFVGGGAYGLWQLHSQYADQVVSLDMEGDRATVVVWRPFVSRVIATPADQFRNWRYEMMKVANNSLPMVLANHADHPRPLRFEVGSGIAISDGFRALAEQAVAAFERPPGD